MAEAPSTEQAAAAATPADSSQEPSKSKVSETATAEPKGRKILEQAKADLKALDNRPPPAESAPEPAATPSPSPTPAPDEDKGSRREQGQRLREQIRKQVEAEFQAEQRAKQQADQQTQQQREFDELVQRAENGDYESKDRVLAILKSNRGMQAAIAQGRTTVLEELGRDITSAVYSLDGLDEEGQQSLMKAPSVSDFGKQAFEQGKRTERAIHESTIATLKAENESLKGRLAGNGPSPVATNGTASTPRGPGGKFASIHDAFAAASGELGYRSQG